MTLVTTKIYGAKQKSAKKIGISANELLKITVNCLGPVHRTWWTVRRWVSFLNER